MSGEFPLQVVAGLVLAVSFAGLIETVRGTGFVEDLENGGIDRYADLESLTEEQQAVVRRARRRGNLWFYPCLVGTVVSVGYLCWSSPIIAVGWIVFCLVSYVVIRTADRTRARRDIRR